jgi:hypothetical protein
MSPSGWSYAVGCAIGCGFGVLLALGDRPRETAVLSILQQELDGRQAGWFWRSRLVREQAGESVSYVPKIPITCGNSMGGNVTREQVGELVAKLAKTYPAGAKLDLGALGADESKLPIMDGDTFTPLAAVALDAVSRLNAAHDGEDVDLSLLATESMDVWPLPPGKDAAGRVEASIAAGVSEFKVETLLRFTCRPDAPHAGAAPRNHEGEKGEVDGPVRSTKGRVALLFVPAYATSTPDGTGIPTLTIRVRQDGELLTPSPAKTSMVWLPSTFDAAKPFEIEATFSAGVWTWGRNVRVTAPDR